MLLQNNRLIVSVAGSGKTTYLVRKALEIKHCNLLITTYTEANEREIRKKFLDLNEFIPSNITIQTWFSFLLQHGVRPYQGVMFEGEIRGMLLVNEASGVNFINKQGVRIPYSEDKEPFKHYFSTSNKIYSDKLSKFVIRCNEKSGGNVIHRLARIFPHIYIDEVQDLAGHDLELLKLLLKSEIRTLFVGDPRQVTYLTHHEKMNSSYRDGKIKQFVLDKCKKECLIDETTLGASHRNNASICRFSSKLYPTLPESVPCSCVECRTIQTPHEGIYLVKTAHVNSYILEYKPTILRYQLAVEPDWNFGNCKGLGFERVIIYPTDPIVKYLKDGLLTKIVKGKPKNAFDIAKLYVALTRARYSVAIVYDYSDEEEFIDDLTKWSPDII